MDKITFSVWVIICIITHIIRTIYEILKHKKILKASKLTFIIMFINMALLWISWFELCANDIHRIELSSFIKYLGISIFGLGIIMFFIALFTIKTLENFEGDLITRGIYSVTRHQMYVGFVLWLIGLPLFFGAVFSLILSFIFILNILFWRYLEEIELTERFTSYAEYKKKTLF